MIKKEVCSKGEKAKEAAHLLAGLSTPVKNAAIKAIAAALEKREEEILAANQKDMEAGRARGLKKSLLDRLLLTTERIKDMADGLRSVADLPDPVGEVMKMWLTKDGLQVGTMRVPLGVVGMIYEARPNVTVDAAGLCLKTGNAVLLRGGSEAFNSNQAIARVLSDAVVQEGLPEGSIQIVETTDRKAVQVMLRMNEYLDVLIPRGGTGLIQMVLQNATVPVIETGIGNCHVYVDSEADLEMALKVVVNAKTQRPGVCNAAETLLVHEAVAERFLPGVIQELQSLGVELRGCKRTREIFPGIAAAAEQDWSTEYLDLIMAVKVVPDMDEAVAHIYRYGSKHTEAIVTENYRKARCFLKEVDAAAVFVNASTRFTDGFQFGFGAEIGISTQKLHARGPMGLEALTSIKYVIYGDGQVRS